MLLLGSLALTGGVALAVLALLLGRKYDIRSVAPIAVLALAGLTLTGILGVHKAPNLVLAPLLGLIIAFQIGRGRGYGQIIAASALPGLLQGLYLMLAASQAPMAREELAAQVFSQLEEMGFSTSGDEGEITRQLLVSLLRLEPAMEFVAGLLTAVLAYGLAQHAARRLGLALPPALPMRLWRLWDQLIWVLIISMAVILITDDGLLDDLAVNALVAMVVLYAVQGLALTRFYMWRMRVPPSLQLLFYAVLFFASGVSSWLLAGAGLLDTRFDWRSLAPEENGKEEIEGQ